jgi:hypothetical protein
MLLFAIVCVVLSLLVLCVRRPAKPPHRSPEYRVDEWVVATILMLMAMGFVLLSLVA